MKTVLFGKIILTSIGNNKKTCNETQFYLRRRACWLWIQLIAVTLLYPRGTNYAKSTGVVINKPEVVVHE